VNGKNTLATSLYTNIKLISILPLKIDMVFQAPTEQSVWSREDRD